MAFVISYRDPRHPDSVGAKIVGNELEVREAFERLQSEGCEVTRITPPPLTLILSGNVPRLVC
jgi:hypothetical protein